MKGLKKYLKLIFSAFACVCAVTCAISPVFANSGPRYEEGITASGAVVQGGQSALAVKSEKLTFDIKDFPRTGETNEFRSAVTAEYKFKNTTENAVRTSMAFPAGNLPDYFRFASEEDVPSSIEPTVTVDGVEVAAQVRHTFGSYESFSDSVKLIDDEWFSNGFYNVNLPVTEYVVSMSAEGYDFAYAVGEFTCDKSKARIIGQWIGNDRLRYYFSDDYSPSGPYYFYVLGDASAFECEWHAEVLNGGKFKTVDLPLIFDKTKETTLKEYVLSLRESDSVVGDLDFYNGVVRNFNTGNVFAAYSKNYYDSEFLTWYTYDVEVEPNGSVINTITAPIYPTIDYRYTPSAYNYVYYLSPAAEWQSFGKLEIEIKTEYYLTAQSYYLDMKEIDGGYRAVLDGLPDGELTFSLCSEASPTFWVPSYGGDNFGMAFGIAAIVMVIVIIVLFLAAIIPLAGVIVAIVYLAKSEKR